MALVINSNGNLAIGKNNPNNNYKLDINGNLNCDNLYIENININSIISDTSNILNTKINNTSNNLSSFLISTDATLNNKINNTSNNLISYNIDNSNILNTKINNTSNNLSSFFISTDATLNTKINNTSNNLISYNNDNSNILNNKINSINANINTNINNINTDTITFGNNNRFIVNDVYDRNVNFTKTLTTSNIITSNLNVIGDTTVLNTTVYQTEQLQIINDTTATALIAKQLNVNKNVVEFYNNNELSFVINNSCNIGIGKTNPLYKLDINGSLNATSIFENNINIATKYLTLSGGTLNGNLNITSNANYLSFGSRTEDLLIRLFSNTYGIGIANSALKYTADQTASHKFYSGTSNVATIADNGNISISGSFSGVGKDIVGINYNNVTINPLSFSTPLSHSFGREG